MTTQPAESQAPTLAAPDHKGPAVAMPSGTAALLMRRAELAAQVAAVKPLQNEIAAIDLTVKSHLEAAHAKCGTVRNRVVVMLAPRTATILDQGRFKAEQPEVHAAYLRTNTTFSLQYV